MANIPFPVDIDLSKVAGNPGPVLMQGVPVCSVAVVSGPPFFSATIQDAQNQSPIALPPVGMSISLPGDPWVNGVTIQAPTGAAGHLLLVFNLELGGAPLGSSAGQGFRVN